MAQDVVYAVRKPFVEFHRRSERFSVIVAHRRAGKTVATINDLIAAAYRNERPEGRYAYIAPLFNQAKDVAWMYLKRYAQPLLASAPNESELRVDLLNGARVRIYGADNPDRLRGLYLDGVVLDEYADMHPGVWGEVIRPLLTDRQGWATFIGTPKGRNAFYDLFQRGLTDPDWQSIMLRASETGLIPAAELEAARRDMTPEQYEQEFECSFEAAILGAYYGREVAEAEREGRIREVPYNPDLPVYTSWDLGISDATAIWFWQTAGQEIHVIDYYEATGEAVGHYAKVKAAKGYRYAEDFVPHDAKAREFGTGRTRVETMIGLNLKPRLIPDHRVMDGINSARVLFPRIWFDAERCKDGLEALRQYRTEYDEKKRAFKDAPRHDWTSHGADAFRYLAMAYREMKPDAKPEPKPLKGVMDMTFDDILRHDDRLRGGHQRIG